jgi:hypothetical protein
MLCSNGHKIKNESPSTAVNDRLACPSCGSKGRKFGLSLKEELKPVDPYNTVVDDSSYGRRVEEACRLFFQRKTAAPNPGNITYDKIRERVKQSFTGQEFDDLVDLANVTDNLAHGNGYGAKECFKRVCERKGWRLPDNKIVKGTGIYSLDDVLSFVAKAQGGDFQDSRPF